jgi:hypothetical protein
MARYLPIHKMLISRGAVTDVRVAPMGPVLTSLTRRPDNDPHRQGWFVYYGDVRVGHIGIRAGVPVDVDQWVYPGCDPGESFNGTGETFEQARAEFEEAWGRLLPKKTEAHFEMWRRQRDHTAWKYRMFDQKCQMPTQRTDGRSRCFCTTGSIERHIQEKHRGIGDPKTDD